MSLKSKSSVGFSELREILFDSIAEIEKDTLSPEQRVSFYWNLSVGRKIAEVTRVTRLQGGKLYIKVADECWKTVLTDLEQKIIKKINHYNRKIRISKILIKTSKTKFDHKANSDQTKTARHKQVVPLV